MATLAESFEEHVTQLSSIFLGALRVSCERAVPTHCHRSRRRSCAPYVSGPTEGSHAALTGALFLKPNTKSSLYLSSPKTCS